jgi:hypothetical protein
MENMAILKLQYNSYEFIELLFPYSQRFSNFIRFGIKSASERKFSSITRRWSIHIKQLPFILDYAKRNFEHIDYSSLPADLQIKIVQLLKKETSEISFSTSIDNPHSVLFVSKDAPWEVIKAAYKALALKHHPDVSGDSDKFKEINNAFLSLKSHFSVQE